MSSPSSTGGFLPASPRVLGVVGLGLIGTSIALAARRRWPELPIVGVDLLGALLHPTVVSTFTLASSELDSLLDADIIAIAAPVDVIESMLPRVYAVARQAELLIDTGSTKRGVIAAAQRAGVDHFVGGHPMAGAASSGPDLARADLFDDRPWFLIEGQSPELMARAGGFVEALGARAHTTDAETHDRIMAAVSHLPQVVASLLMNVVADATDVDERSLAGGGLRDTTRLAASPPGMWTSVLAANADMISPLLADLATRLLALAPRLDDAAEVERIFRDAVAARAALDATTRAI